jgi:undecaprenyl diphosphate synthase
MAQISLEINESKTLKAPLNHIAFIMDGNGRWAKKRFMPREYGHKSGANTFRKIMKSLFLTMFPQLIRE